MGGGIEVGDPDDDEERVCGFRLSLFRKEEITLRSVGF